MRSTRRGSYSSMAFWSVTGTPSSRVSEESWDTVEGLKVSFNDTASLLVLSTLLTRALLMNSMKSSSMRGKRV